MDYSDQVFDFLVEHDIDVVDQRFDDGVLVVAAEGKAFLLRDDDSIEAADADPRVADLAWYLSAEARNYEAALEAEADIFREEAMLA